MIDMYRSGLFCLLLFFAAPVFASQNPGYLGISIKSDKVYSQTGLRIVNVFDDGAAWVAGLKENDLITHLNGVEVEQASTFHKLLAPFQWGDAVDIRYIRDGQNKEARIILGFEVRTRTYEILKSEQILGEVIWYFDDNTTIILKQDRPLSITKKFDDGEKETFSLADLDDYSAIPQRFRDLEDKLDVIRRSQAEQEAQHTDADQITFIKEAVPEGNSSDEASVENMRVSEFKLFPNPSNGQFEVRLVTEERGLLTWDIYDVRGSSVESGHYGDFGGTFEQKFDLPSKFHGTYLIYFRVGNKRISQQLILQ
jgi:hypothetical protein